MKAGRKKKAKVTLEFSEFNGDVIYEIIITGDFTDSKSEMFKLAERVLDVAVEKAGIVPFKCGGEIGYVAKKDVEL